MSGLSLIPYPSPRLTMRNGRLVGQRGLGRFAWLTNMFRTMETRRHLSEMDARMLQDIGISRSEALRESARAPWDITQSRL